MNEPNTTIKIDSGNYVLKNSEDELVLNGEIYFSWFPTLGVRFNGIAKADSKLKFLIEIFKSDYLFLYKEDLNYGQCFLSKTELDSEGNVIILGRFISDAIFGDKCIKIETVEFSIPNLKRYIGEHHIIVSEGKEKHFKNKLTLENEKYKVVIYQDIDYSKQSDKLKNLGGFLILHSGELTSRKNLISFKEQQNVLGCLGTFLSFWNGKRTNILFRKGIIEKELKWSDYSNYQVAPYQYFHSWSPGFSMEFLNDLWKSFWKLWQNETDKDFLNSCIHWYIESNSGSGYLEGSIVMAQTALELIFNWWIVEDKKMILGKDSENLSAANKIRLILSQINISEIGVPDHFDALREFIKSDNQIKDGADAIVNIRNAVIHSQAKKRKKLSSIDYMIKYEVLHLSLWYIELSLLKILNYNGKYANRLSSRDVSLKNSVPWN